MLAALTFAATAFSGPAIGAIGASRTAAPKMYEYSTPFVYDGVSQVRAMQHRPIPCMHARC